MSSAGESVTSVLQPRQADLGPHSRNNYHWSRSRDIHSLIQALSLIGINSTFKFIFFSKSIFWMFVSILGEVAFLYSRLHVCTLNYLKEIWNCSILQETVRLFHFQLQSSKVTGTTRGSTCIVYVHVCPVTWATHIPTRKKSGTCV